MSKKSQWEIEREQRIAKQAKAMKALTDDQLAAIDLVVKSLRSSLNSLNEIQDLYLSDVRDLETAYWKMYNAFNKRETE